jgi:hypothetical protein
MKISAKGIREFITIILAFAVIHYFFQYFYHLSLWEVVEWWTCNFFKVEDAVGYALSLFFGTLLYILAFFGFANTFYLGVFGQNQVLVYLGNCKKNTGAYYKLNDVRKSLLTAYDAENEYNFSFENLLKPQSFKKDFGAKNSVGTKDDRFTLFSFLALTCIMGSILLADLGVFHSFAFQVWKTQPTNAALPFAIDAQSAFDYILKHFHLSRGSYILLILSLLFCFIGFSIANTFTAKKLGHPVEVLPSSIHPNAIIKGVPLEIKPRFVKSTKPSPNTSGDEHELVDSGDRYVNFEFSEGFNHPVYVTAIVHPKRRQGILEEVEKHLKANMPMNLKIGKRLNITICQTK